METTIYDAHRRARIYIADDGDNSIYTWDGKAVAVIDGEHVFGWRGRHIGWFVEGILYDGQGYRIGFLAETFPVATYPEPAKYSKHAKAQRLARHAPRGRPAFSAGNSNEDLETFIRQDAA